MALASESDDFWLQIAASFHERATFRSAGPGATQRRLWPTPPPGRRKVWREQDFAPESLLYDPRDGSGAGPCHP